KDWDDDDPYPAPPEIHWKLTGQPAGSTAVLAPCARPGGGAAVDTCFTGDVAGRYDIEVVFDDPHGASGSQHTSVAVDRDRAPRLASACPPARARFLLLDAGPATRRAVTQVADDLDAWPAGAGPHDGAARFTWSLRRDGDPDFAAIDGYNLPYLDLEPADAPGDHVQVRVQVTDRNPAHILACPAEQRECDYVSQCAGWQTWEIEYR